MKVCANVNVMFADLPFMERFAVAKAAGFDGIEIPFPYDHPVPEILAALALHDLKMVMIACPPPNYTGADRGFAALPGAENRFRRDFKRTIRYAKALGTEHVHVMSVLPSISLLFPCGFPLVFLWFSDCFPLVSIWFSYGSPMDSIEFPCGFLVISTWFPYGVLLVSLWFIWFPYGCLMISSWLPLVSI